MVNNNILNRSKTLLLIFHCLVCTFVLVGQESRSQEPLSAEFARSLPYDSLAVLRTPVFSQALDKLDSFDFGPVSEIAERLSAVSIERGLSVDTGGSSAIEELRERIETITGDGAATIVAVKNSNGAVQWVAIFDQSRIRDLDAFYNEVTSIRELLVGVLKIVGLPVAMPETTELVKEDITELPGDVASLSLFAGSVTSVMKKVYCSLNNGRLVLATSKDSLISVAKCIENDAKKTLHDNRAFMLTWSHLVSLKEPPDLMVYLSPQMGDIFDFKSLFNYKNVLPTFFESVPSDGIDEAIAGVGIQAMLIQDGEPSLLIQSVARTKFPKAEFFQAMRADGEIQLPRLTLDDWLLEEIQASCIDFDGMYKSLASDPNLISDAEGPATDAELDEAMQGIENRYKLTFRYKELFERLGGSYWMARLRKKDKSTFKTIRCFKFQTANDAEWYGLQRSKSGYLNKKFPLERKELAGVVAFVRPDQIAKKLESSFGKKSNSEAILVAGNWCLVVPPDLVRPFTESVGVSMFFPTKLESLFRKVENLSQRNDQPFYSMYWSPRRWNLQQQSLAYLLNFEKDNRERGGVAHRSAPKNLFDRLLMTCIYRLRQSFVNKMGESVFVAYSDEKSIQVFSGFFPTGKYKLEGSIADPLDYLPKPNAESIK